ncbi:hypothetical protein J437_LFUL007053 [Ladona fulva]|uniref:Chitin-binding type-2 domain-containing protein n=1 Tax=Ladona fulva TaxID=123851 RepID=A0A8K0K9N8_LADFU|nr:hypothetical protein J437_LFUL007053 [Ladona fulva]
MSRLYITLVFGLAFSVNLISARSNTPMRREDGIHCYKEGLNANPDNSKEFIICAKDGEGKFIGATYSCSDGEEFDQNTMSCVQVLSRRKLRNIIPLGCGHCDTSTTAKPDVIPTTTVPEVTVPECKNRTIHCLPDCHTLRLCYESGGVYQHLSDVPCNEGDYCDDSTASCTNKIPSSCPADFTCMDSGYYPDPSDCTKYYICYPSDNIFLASAQYCAANQVYSTSKKICVPKIKLSDCHTVKCPAGVVQHAVFPGDASYYVICRDGKPEYVTCKSAGRMPDPDHCNQYYECTAGWLGSKFTLTSHSCPPGLGFNKATLLCDAETSCN